MAINRVERLIINLDTAMPITCAWDTCDRPGRTPYQLRTHEHPPGWRCDHPFARHTIFAFCCDGHLDYWASSSGGRALELADRNRGRIAGMHSAGNRLMNR